MYRSDSIYAYRGPVPDGLPPLPDTPTAAAPGTPEKIEAMEKRVKAKRAVHHPADAKFPGDPRPLEWMERNRRRVA